jgi:hypothetical protein
MTPTDDILRELGAIKSSLADMAPSSSPYCRGNKAAAIYAGYKSAKSFLAWADRVGIRPSVDGGIWFWRKDEIVRAREKGKA